MGIPSYVRYCSFYKYLQMCRKLNSVLSTVYMKRFKLIPNGQHFRCSVLSMLLILCMASFITHFWNTGVTFSKHEARVHELSFLIILPSLVTDHSQHFLFLILGLL